MFRLIVLFHTNFLILLKTVWNIFSENGKQFWFEVFIYGGKKGTGLDVIDLSKKIEELGAGEI